MHLALCSNGYCLLKKELTITEKNKIIKDLTIFPKTMGIQNPNPYYVYRESEKRLFVPLHYGISNYGFPQKNILPNGENIKLNFNGSLRENQVPVVNSYLNHVKQNDFGGGLLELPCAYGKTVLSLKIISELCKKTLIIVNKEFLMNQWIERINQFLPSAKIGKIQGPTIDIENKDIVIAMLQSLSLKDYEIKVFSSFGLTIIDEVHHMSSETFSLALFKVVTKYMLGLSATMERKDGTSHVFKMFLGDVIYKGKSAQRKVIVHAIEYNTNDPEFNTTVYDYKGNPAYSTMISKICEYNLRTEFILSILKKLLLENSNQQIMILAHNKNVLTYLFDAIKHRDMCSVGYYLGGMKENALKESEKKQVIIATYAMAAEALDIKTLTTLIMATPKTDIEQCVGRILRDEYSSPLVIDIIDSHQLFKNQWLKRKRFYSKNKYIVEKYNSKTYFLNENKNENELNDYEDELNDELCDDCLI